MSLYETQHLTMVRLTRSGPYLLPNLISYYSLFHTQNPGALVFLFFFFVCLSEAILVSGSLPLLFSFLLCLHVAGFFSLFRFFPNHPIYRRYAVTLMFLPYCNFLQSPLLTILFNLFSVCMHYFP